MGPNIEWNEDKNDHHSKCLKPVVIHIMWDELSIC